jgi:hypothetical protein
MPSWDLSIAQDVKELLAGEMAGADRNVILQTCKKAVISVYGELISSSANNTILEINDKNFVGRIREASSADVRLTRSQMNSDQHRSIPILIFVYLSLSASICVKIPHACRLATWR